MQAKMQAKMQPLQTTPRVKAEAKTSAMQVQPTAQSKAEAKAQAKAHVVATAFVEQGVKQAQGQPAVLFAAQAETLSQARAKSLTRAHGIPSSRGSGSVALPHHLPPLQRLKSGPSDDALGAPHIGDAGAGGGREHMERPGTTESGTMGGTNAQAAPWDASGAPRHGSGTSVTWSSSGV